MLQDVYLQVLLTILTPVVKIWLLLKLTYFDKNNSLHSIHFDKESVLALEKCTRVWWPWFIFCCYQQTVVANWLRLTGNFFITTFLTLGSKPIIVFVNHSWSHSMLICSIQRHLIQSFHGQTLWLICLEVLWWKGKKF